MGKKVNIKTNQTMSFTYWKGDKKLNDFLRSLDLFSYEEGLFVKERGIISFKDQKEINEAWKEKFVRAFIEGCEKLGFEVYNIAFRGF